MLLAMHWGALRFSGWCGAAKNRWNALAEDPGGLRGFDTRHFFIGCTLAYGVTRSSHSTERAADAWSRPQFDSCSRSPPPCRQCCQVALPNACGSGRRCAAHSCFVRIRWLSDLPKASPGYIRFGVQAWLSAMTGAEVRLCRFRRRPRSQRLNSALATVMLVGPRLVAIRQMAVSVHRPPDPCPGLPGY